MEHLCRKFEGEGTSPRRLAPAASPLLLALPAQPSPAQKLCDYDRGRHGR